MKNLFFFWGQEDFLINSEIEKIKTENIDKNFETMAYKHIYEPCFDDVINAVRSLPMMFGNVMHVIDVNGFYLSKDKDSDSSSVDEWELTQFEDALKNASEKNIIVFRCIIPPDSKKKVDTRKKLYKITSKYFNEKQYPLFRHYDKELPEIISKLGKKSDLTLSKQVISYMIEQIGTNLGIINSELEKLAIVIYPSKTPTVDDIKNICTKKDDVFSVLEAVFQNNIGKALSELKKSLEKSSIQEIFAAIQYSLRNFSIIKTYYKYGKSALSQQLHIPEFVIEQNYNLMSKISEESIYKLRNNLLKTEYSIKTGDCISPENSLEMALMEVCDV